MNAERPDYTLKHIQQKFEEPPAIFPVGEKPWDLGISRRTFIGICLSAGAVLLNWNAMKTQAAEAAETSAQPAFAGAFVNPDLLSMVGIETGTGDTIEKGYHLRWFNAMPFPANAFPLNTDLIRDFLNPDFSKPLQFENPKQGSDKPPDPNEDPQKNKGVNLGVPPAFLIYRRDHHARFRHKLSINFLLLRMVRQRSSFVPIPSIRLSREHVRLAQLLKKAPDSVWKQLVRSRRLTLIWARNRKGEALRITFRQPNGKGLRAVHLFKLTFEISSSDPPVPMALEGYGEDPEEPIRRSWFKWKKRGGNRWIGSVTWVQGHYSFIEIMGAKLHPFRINFSYMDEDTRVAQDPLNPRPGEWVLINSIPFITRFQTWEVAKAQIFRHQMTNRYLTFDDSSLHLDDWSRRLDVKYKSMFPHLQRAFLRLRYAQILDQKYLQETNQKTLTEIRYEPKLFYQLWSLDPIIAALFSQKYADVPGAHNPHPPELGSTYDYMVTTAWQPPAQRLSYIVQKVSGKTTPKVLPPRQFIGAQNKGLHREGDYTLYRTNVSWRPPPDNLQGGTYGYYEPPLYDVRQRDKSGQERILTHYTDSTAQSSDDKIVDVPIHGVATPPDILDEETRNRLSEPQRNALDLQQILQARESGAAITSAQLNAYRQMLRAPLTQFFRPQDDRIEYTDWVRLKSSQDQRELFYGIRSIDLFGRTSKWLKGTPVTVSHNVPPSSAVNVKAYLVKERNGAEMVAVSWRLGPRELRSGAPVNHFNVLWKFHESHIGSQSARRFEDWKDQKLNENPIDAQSPVNVTVETVDALEGTSIYGQIVAAEGAGIDTRVAEEKAFLGEEKRVIYLKTDQCFLGVTPFVDIVERYGSVPAEWFDSLKIRLKGKDYDVVGIKGGSSLEIGIAVDKPADDKIDPAKAFLDSLGSNKAFRLTFTKVKTEISWRQKLAKVSFPEIESDADLSVQTTYDEAFAKEMLARPSILMKVDSPFGVEITGRKFWFTNEAWLEYTYSGYGIQRVPVIEFDAITVTPSRLDFGTILVSGAASGQNFEIPVGEVTLVNGGPTKLKVPGVTSDNAVFKVRSPSFPAEIDPGAEFIITVRFEPAAEENYKSGLRVQTDGGSITISLTGTGTDDEKLVKSDPRSAVARRFLASVTLSPVVLEKSQQVNPVPVYPLPMLKNALQNGATTYDFKIKTPSYQQVTLKHYTTVSAVKPARQLKASCGAELAFVTGENNSPRQIICDVLTRPSGQNSSKLSFLIRSQLQLPLESIGPSKNQQCNFYPIYRQELSLPDHDRLKPDKRNTEIIDIAVSSHRKSADSGYADEQNNLVSVPFQIRLPATRPALPQVAKPKLPDPETPWEDPFVVAYTSLPKILDNRKVVQFKIKLDDEQLMKGTFGFPSNAELELYRAPQDGLRILILDYIKSQLPPNTESDTDYIEFIDFLSNHPEYNLNTFIELKSKHRHDFAFETLNRMIPVKQYQVIVACLIRFWNNNKYSLKNAFKLIGKIPEPRSPENKLHLIDELEGIAGGNVFYAIRTVRNGTESSPLKLLPFRVTIPDTALPAVPEGVKAAGGIEQATIQWRVSPDTDISKYEIHRTDTMVDASDIRTMNLVKEFSVIDARQDPTEHHAPLKAVQIKQSLKAMGGRIAAWFPEDSVTSIQGVYVLKDFDSASMPLKNQSATNYFTQNSTFDSARGKLEKVNVPIDNSGKNQDLAIVYYYPRKTVAPNPFSIHNGSILLPSIQRVLGVYYQWDFDYSSNPQNQPGYNFLDKGAAFIDHYVINLSVADGETMVVVYSDVRQGISIIDSLSIKNEKLWIPFGPGLLSVTGVYAHSDENRTTNLFLSDNQFNKVTDTITNISLGNGEKVVLELITTDYRWTAEGVFNSIIIPSSLLGQQIVGLLETKLTDGVIDPGVLMSENNLLEKGFMILNNIIFFPHVVKHETPLTIVTDDQSGGYKFTAIDEREYQHINTGLPPGTYYYRIAAVKGRIKSPPTRLLRVNVD